MQVVGILFLTSLLASACGTGDEPPPSAAVTGANSGNTTTAVTTGGGTCEDGDSRTCEVKIGEQNGVVTCFVGTQICEDGMWGPCDDHGELGDTSGFFTVSLSAAADCPDNPCDPECQNFDEIPMDPIISDENPNAYTWETGGQGSMPASVSTQVYDEPCATGADCQQNSYCHDPVSGSCSHHICETGAGLVDGCGECASDICAARPECCTRKWGCAHHACTTGPPLELGCSPCVDTICGNDPYCCNTWWDSICVSAAVGQPNCGCFACNPACAHCETATGSALNAGCSTCAGSVCGYDPYCCNNNWDSLCVAEALADPNCLSCSHDPCVTGPPLNISCGVEIDTVCAANPSCCSTSWTQACVDAFTNAYGGCPANSPGTWDQSCVDEVFDTCGAYCDSPPNSQGECVPWVPGQTNPDCGGFDLSVGYTCSNPQNTIPICNHGTQTAPAGIDICIYPANVSFLGDPNPPACNTIANTNTCTTSEPIPPGECIAVTSCNVGNNRKIHVNGPPNPTEPECNKQDNWGVFFGGTCGEPACGGIHVAATFTQVNMFIAVDKSGSMSTDNRWGKTRNAFTAFFQDPGSAGLNVALEFFPYSASGGHDGCYNGSSECGNPGPCSNPRVPLGTLTAQSAPADNQEQQLINAFNSYNPGGGTPLLLAQQGAYAWSAAQAAADPGSQQVVVLVTDGYPNYCGSAQASFVNAASNAFAANGTLTYGIGIVGANQNLLNNIASAGGGQSYFISNANNIEQELVAAMNAIAGDTVPCVLDLPQGTYDPNDVQGLFYPQGQANPTNLTLTTSSASCSNNRFYFDDPNNPTQIILCPQLCNQIQGSADTEVDFYFPCLGQYEPTTVTETYEAQCPAGLTPQWNWFGYDTSTPSTTTIDFSVKVASSEAGLATAMSIPLATAQSTPTDTQLCPMNGSVPGCPISLYNTIGSPGAHLSWLELSAYLQPTQNMGTTPSLNSWNISYTCVPAD